MHKLTYRHICEHVLAQLSRVVARDSSIATAGVQDLYVALCEDESIWGLFKRLQGESRPVVIANGQSKSPWKTLSRHLHVSARPRPSKLRSPNFSAAHRSTAVITQRPPFPTRLQHAISPSTNLATRPLRQSSTLPSRHLEKDQCPLSLELPLQLLKTVAGIKGRPAC